MSVWVAGPGRRHGDPGPDSLDEWLGRGRSAAVVGDLEQVDGRQTGCQQGRIDLLLDIAHQQESTPTHIAEDDDGDVVDPRPAIGRLDRHVSGDRPQDAQGDLVDPQVIARGEPEADGGGRPGHPPDPGRVAGTRSAHPGLEDAIDPVSIEEQAETRDVILVRMAQDHRVDPPVPRWDAAVEFDEEAVWIRSAVDQQAAAA